MENEISSYGSWSPVVVVALIFISTAIPPLPLPVPLIEIAAGLLFGFWEGFLLVWLGQMISSIFAFAITRYAGQRFLKRFFEYKLFTPFKSYIQNGGTWAVLIARATMAAPFNIVSFLAGATSMKIGSFSLATAVGVLIESSLYPFVGSVLGTTRLSLWRIFIVVIIVGAIGPVISYAVMNILQAKKKDAKKHR
jgi:uncharacterized membrane protein YdjX (TVP38/TMEM64 family)